MVFKSRSEDLQGFEGMYLAKSYSRMRRMKQHKEFMEARKALLEKVAARSFAKNYLYSLRIDVSSLGHRQSVNAHLCSLFYPVNRCGSEMA